MEVVVGRGVIVYDPISIEVETKAKVEVAGAFYFSIKILSACLC